MAPKNGVGRGVKGYRRSAANAGFHQPFKDLAAMVRQRGLCLSSKPSGARWRRAPEGGALFAEAMQAVQPLPQEGAFTVPQTPAPRSGLTPVDEEDEALACLADLVAGKGKFDLSVTDEYVEGHVTGLNPRLLGALKAGAFPIQDWCDLHGLTAPQAKEHLEAFLERAGARGFRVVLVVHGRGRGSPDHLPVLKHHLQTWLVAKRFRRQVAAFATAQPYDGGTGALYLLLRRRPS